MPDELDESNEVQAAAEVLGPELERSFQHAMHGLDIIYTRPPVTLTEEQKALIRAQAAQGKKRNRRARRQSK